MSNLFTTAEESLSTFLDGKSKRLEIDFLIPRSITPVTAISLITFESKVLGFEGETLSLFPTVDEVLRSGLSTLSKREFSFILRCGSTGFNFVPCTKSAKLFPIAAVISKPPPSKSVVFCSKK